MPETANRIEASPTDPACFPLLEYLADSNVERTPYRDLPKHLQDMDILETCRALGFITYVAWLDADQRNRMEYVATGPWEGMSAYIGSGAWADIVTAVKRHAGSNDCSEYLLVELIGQGHHALRERRLEDRQQTRHSVDYRSVRWRGVGHKFSAKQAACVRPLWEAMDNKTPVLAEGTILEKAGVGDRQRLRDVFRRHRALGTMIVKGADQDTWRLSEPNKT